VTFFVDHSNVKVLFRFDDFESESLIEADGFLVCSLNVKVDCVLEKILPTSMYQNCSGKVDHFTIKLSQTQLKRP